ncbi:MAG: NGG1p interacting factor NIF3 [Candidatus Omnitrophota bacterium]
MKLSVLYNQAVKLGRRYDPRGNRPWRYADSAILFGKLNTEVKKILVGIDMEVSELLLADKLRERQGLDLVIAHHPEGWALAHFYEVMKLQVDLLKGAGVDSDVAHQLIEDRQNEIQRKVLPVNHMRAVDAARLLNLPFICLHTPADNHVSFFIDRLLRKERPKQLRGIIDILHTLPEYRQAKKNYAGPRIISGNPYSNPGKIFVEMTGGTEGSKGALGKLARRGIRTLVSMHQSEEYLRKAKEKNLNVVIAGHISSDNLGLNLLLDGIEKREKLEVISCSGFRRFKHRGL